MPSLGVSTWGSSHQGTESLAPFEVSQHLSNYLCWTPTPCKASPWWVQGKDMVHPWQQSHPALPHGSCPVSASPAHPRLFQGLWDGRPPSFRNSQEPARVGKACNPLAGGRQQNNVGLGARVPGFRLQQHL